MISHPHPTYVEVDFASINSIHGAVQKQIVPDDGETSKREQQHGMQEVRKTEKRLVKTRCGYEYDYVCIYQDESQREG